ncbi:MAG: glycosyltransferase family 4 protein [Acaryochloridaceae cyanobacterium SU_2_1]|nr:glycosyltransferase family 4 protein [Acaryochloridaceae cyanobacterium SU_2_1]
MNPRPLKVLLVIEQCNPDWSSVPLLAYHYFRELSNRVQVTLVTHERNRQGLTRAGVNLDRIVYIAESAFTQHYYRWALQFIPQGMNNWPLYHVLTYPIYAEFNRQVYQQFHQAVIGGEYDLVHVLTPMMPRYPVKLVQVCHKTPFVLGPVNGGIPFPPGFAGIAQQEFAYLNFFRSLGRWLIPGYRQTYEQATQILVGSTYTYGMLQGLFDLPEDRLQLFYENGVDQGFTPAPETVHQARPASFSIANPLKLLFVGRLVPYKCADVVIAAIATLPKQQQQKIQCTLVGDGPQGTVLAEQIETLGLQKQINMVGWISQNEIAPYYQQADLFCFPSIREFGGAVVLEAMASGLPCIVTNYGGIGEYVTPETGFKLEPVSKAQLIVDLAASIQQFFQHPELLPQMSEQALQRAGAFQWPHKAEELISLYNRLIPPKVTAKTAEQPNPIAVPAADQ